MFAALREQLRQVVGPYELRPALSPTAQLVKGMISSRTRDEVSLPAFVRLMRRFSTWPELAAASAGEVQATIFDVQWPERKAPQIVAALRMVRASRPDYDLRFLRRGSLMQALAWLTAIPGVGPKIAAATVNFSTLCMPAFVIDTHVLRVLRRLRLVDPAADIATAYDETMRTLAGWSAAELQDLHVLFKAFGQTVCHEVGPACARCPLRAQRPSAFPQH